MRQAGIASVLVVGLLAAAVAEARVQGAKGRRLEVFHALESYRGGLLLVEEPELVAGSTKRAVRDQHLRSFAHQFLRSRLRELPWTVEPWYAEFGAVAREEARLPTLVADPTLFVQGRLLVLEVFLRDLHSGRVVARFQGFGRSVVRSAWPGARDDLQELSRVLTAYLAEELKVSAPDWNGYEPEPYRRRDRDRVGYRMLKVNKDRDLPHARHHDRPPINDRAREERGPVRVELSDER